MWRTPNRPPFKRDRAGRSRMETGGYAHFFGIVAGERRHPFGFESHPPHRRAVTVHLFDQEQQVGPRRSGGLFCCFKIVCSSDARPKCRSGFVGGAADVSRTGARCAGTVEQAHPEAHDGHGRTVCPSRLKVTDPMPDDWQPACPVPQHPHHRQAPAATTSFRTDQARRSGLSMPSPSSCPRWSASCRCAARSSAGCGPATTWLCASAVRPCSITPGPERRSWTTRSSPSPEPTDRSGAIPRRPARQPDPAGAPHPR